MSPPVVWNLLGNSYFQGRFVLALLDWKCPVIASLETRSILLPGWNQLERVSFKHLLISRPFFILSCYPIALKIHCSTACKQLLDRLGGYILEERGEIKIKGKGDMVTYWLIGEKFGSQHRLRGHRNHSSNRPKSSLRNTGHKLIGDRHCRDLASSLDSPKKLRFANPSSSSPSGTGVEILDETSPFVTSKRNSCPNLKAGSCVMLQPTLTRSIERKLYYQPHRLSTTSLVEALTFSLQAKTASNGRPQPFSPANNKRGENPKIELSPPEESLNDCWPLLDPTKHVNENDRETCV